MFFPNENEQIPNFVKNIIPKDIKKALYYIRLTYINAKLWKSSSGFYRENVFESEAEAGAENIYGQKFHCFQVNKLWTNANSPRQQTASRSDI